MVCTTSAAQDKTSTSAQGNPNQVVNQVIYELKGWGYPAKTIAFSRGKAKIDVTFASREKSVSKEVRFATDRFDAIAEKVIQAGFFDLPSNF